MDRAPAREARHVRASGRVGSTRYTNPFELAVRPRRPPNGKDPMTGTIAASLFAVALLAATGCATTATTSENGLPMVGGAEMSP